VRLTPRQIEADNDGMSEPTTRELIVRRMQNTGGAETARRMAMWFGRPAADVRSELERMEGDGLIERWHEAPGLEWRWVPLTIREVET
jgi:hypothetical protein